MAANILEINDDHIVKIQPETDIILAKDSEGNELCRLAFEVDGRQVTFKTPIIAKYPKFVKKLTELMVYMSQYAPNLELPDDKVSSYNNQLYDEIWNRLSSMSIAFSPKTKDMILDLFFNYLDGSISGISATKKWWYTDETLAAKIKKLQRAWVNANFRIDTVQRIFSACLAIDDLIKKNALFLIEKELAPHNSTKSNLSNISVLKPDSTPTSTTDIPPSSFAPL